MKIILKISSLLLTLALFSCGTQAKEDVDAIDPGVTEKNDLDPVTVDSFFEYMKNPQFENSEKIGTEIPYYARRMFEVRTSRDAKDLKAAETVNGQQLKKTLPVFDKIESAGKIEKVSADETAQAKEAVAELEKIYGHKSGISVPELCTYLKEAGVDWKDKAALVLGIMDFSDVCFELSIEGGMPLNYIEELNGLSKDSVFVPTYLSQQSNTGSSAVEQVQFVFNGILFRFSPMDQEDYYDSQIIVAAANLALRSKQISERYYQLNDDVHVIFGTKEQVKGLCEKFKFNLK